MENKNNSNRIHPLVAAAAIAVLLASLVGIAAITGLLPNSNSASAQQEVIAALDKEAAEKAAEAKAAEERATEAQAAAEKARQAQLKDENRRTAKTQAAKSSNKVTQTQICYTCGRVESVRVVQTAANPSGVGAVGGAVVGGLLGNQVGKGSGRSLATVAGAVGGGFAGNEIEKRTRTASTYEVGVRMEDGKLRNFPYNNQPNWSIGDRVRVENGYLRAR